MTTSQSFGPIGKPINVGPDGAASPVANHPGVERVPSPEPAEVYVAPDPVLGDTHVEPDGRISVFDGTEWVLADDLVAAMHHSREAERQKVRNVEALIPVWEDAAGGERPQERTRQMMFAAIAELREALGL